MKALLQKVTEASVIVEGKTISKINHGFLVLLGVTHSDEKTQAEQLAKKLLNLRLFDGTEGQHHHLSVQETSGEILVVSQFTLYGNCQKGRRPSFDKAARPEHANTLYEYFVEYLRSQSELAIKTGKFQATMQVHLINDGPVTFMIENNADSK